MSSSPQNYKNDSLQEEWMSQVGSITIKMSSSPFLLINFCGFTVYLVFSPPPLFLYRFISKIHCHFLLNETFENKEMKQNKSFLACFRPILSNQMYGTYLSNLTEPEVSKFLLLECMARHEQISFGEMFKNNFFLFSAIDLN